MRPLVQVSAANKLIGDDEKKRVTDKVVQAQLWVTGYFRARAAGGGVRGALHDHDFKFQERPF
jgi:hypothetical protein